MQAHSGKREDRTYFRFVVAFDKPAIEVDWDTESDFALFPLDIATALIDRGYAVPISEEAVNAYNTELEERQKAPPKKAPKQAAPKPPENGPATAEAKAPAAAAPAAAAKAEAASPSEPQAQAVTPPWGGSNTAS